jgi:hypothetical protein
VCLSQAYRDRKHKDLCLLTGKTWGQTFLKKPRTLSLRGQAETKRKGETVASQMKKLQRFLIKKPAGTLDFVECQYLPPFPSEFSPSA